MKKVLVYPFDRAFVPEIEYLNLIEEIEKLYLCSPHGWGYVGELFEWKGKQVRVESEFEKLVHICDEVWIVDSYNKLFPEDVLQKKIEYAVHKNKKVIFNYNNCALGCSKNVGTSMFIDINRYLHMREKIYEINLPVIGIVGISEETDKFELQLLINRILKNKGYNVSHIASRNNIGLIDIHPFPSWLFDADISEKDKIICFNHYVKEIELRDKPDLILIGIPGGILPINDRIYENFGILHYEISWAVTFDYVFCSLLFGNYGADDLNQIRQRIKEIFRIEIDCFNLSTTILNPVEMDSKESKNYIMLQGDNVIKKLDKMISKECVSTKLHKSVEEAVTNMIEILNLYTKLEII